MASIPNARRAAAALALAGLAIAAAIAAAAPALAQSRERLRFIRDAEIEDTIRTFAAPIFGVAGIPPDDVSIALVENRQPNAFVAGGMNLFLHTGLLQMADDAGQVIGVIAHETGHIAGGHLIRGRDAMESASAQAILGMLLGIGAAVVSGRGDAAIATTLGASELARRNLLAFSRAQEASADQAALTYLDRARLSARGMLAFLEKLSGAEAAPTGQVDYLRTHPLTRDRVDTVRTHVERSGNSDQPLTAETIDRFARLQAKLDGFVDPVMTLRRHGAADTTLAGRYARAIALYRRGDVRQALPAIDALIAAEPANPYFHELKGQVLLENGRVGDSLAPYRRAVALAPTSGLLRASLAQALLQSNDGGAVDEALQHLDVARRQEARTPLVWRLMATGWGRQGKQGMAAYALAEEALTKGESRTAQGQAKRAMDLLPYGSPSWLRAQDIETVAGEMAAED